MASGFFAVLDDISALMDDMASMSKVATKKTAGILGDDLAVNAEKATGFVASRELPVLWAIIKGSFLNKLIILPIAFLLSAFLPAAITIILLLGGVYLAYEGAEKIIVYFFGHKKGQSDALHSTPAAEMPGLEKKKVRQAILTDFILSVEIVIIALSTVLGKPLITQILVVSAIAVLATIGVYGIVALIVRMDDIGCRLISWQEGDDGLSDKVGRFLVNALPWVIKGLSIVGTIALLLVSGGIFNHNLEFMHHLFEGAPTLIKDFIVGLVAGSIAVVILKLLRKGFSG
jgi:predicted DNA repair protein MutK